MSKVITYKLDCDELGILDLPFGRDEDFEVRAEFEESGVAVWGDWAKVNIYELTEEILKQVPRTPLYEYLALLASVGYIFASYGQSDLMDKIIQRYLADADSEMIEAWSQCLAIGSTLDHYKPAKGAGYVLEEEGIIKDENYTLLLERYGPDY